MWAQLMCLVLVPALFRLRIPLDRVKLLVVHDRLLRDPGLLGLTTTSMTLLALLDLVGQANDLVPAEEWDVDLETAVMTKCTEVGEDSGVDAELFIESSDNLLGHTGE